MIRYRIFIFLCASMVVFLNSAQAEPAQAFQLSDIPKLLDVFRARRAREMCSCYFVVHQTQEFCRSWLSEADDVPTLAWGFPLIGVTVDDAAKSVSVDSRRAHWVSEPYGCVLDDARN